MRPRIPGLLRRNANFRRYFIGQSASLVGDQITTIALPLTAVLALHATPCAGRMRSRATRCPSSGRRCS